MNQKNKHTNISLLSKVSCKRWDRHMAGSSPDRHDFFSPPPLTPLLPALLFLYIQKVCTLSSFSFFFYCLTSNSINFSVVSASLQSSWANTQQSGKV